MTDSASSRTAMPRWFPAAVVALLALIAALLIAVLVHSGGSSSDRTTSPVASASLPPSAATDYPDGGTAQTVTVVITPGMTAVQVGRVLQTSGVVLTMEAYVEAANSNPASPNLQAGSFVLHTKMKASLALDAMLGQKPGAIPTAKT